MSNKAKITVNLFDGRRKPFPPGRDVLITLRDGFQKQIHREDHKASSISFEVPFHNNFGDDYAVIAHAGKHFQVGFAPVRVSPQVDQIVDLMLLPNNGGFNFAGATLSNR